MISVPWQICFAWKLWKVWQETLLLMMLFLGLLLNCSEKFGGCQCGCVLHPCVAVHVACAWACRHAFVQCFWEQMHFSFCMCESCVCMFGCMCVWVRERVGRLERESSKHLSFKKKIANVNYIYPVFLSIQSSIKKVWVRRKIVYFVLNQVPFHYLVTWKLFYGYMF